MDLHLSTRLPCSKCRTDFDLSLTALTSVLSKAEGERIGMDAGLKSLSCERGIPVVKDILGYPFKG